MLNNPFLKYVTSVAIFVHLLLCVSCSSQDESENHEFHRNRVLERNLRNQSDDNRDLVFDDIHRGLTYFFGTPDEPLWPQGLLERESASVINVSLLERAAGQVRRNVDRVESGLYRKHCANCHGMTGDGLGPAAALLNPYPRDFRRGTFKFKDTRYGYRPALNDIVSIIRNGIPGTSMPSMRNLEREKFYDDDIVVIANYVRYLSIRGEVERQMLLQVAPQWDKAARIFDNDLAKSFDLHDSVQMASSETLSSNELWIETIQGVVNRWNDQPRSTFAEFVATKPQFISTLIEAEPMVDSAKAASIFEGTATACSTCHGKSGVGNPLWVDYDEWTKDNTVRYGIDPTKKEQWRDLKAFGLLKPIPSSARNLTLGAFRNPQLSVNEAEDRSDASKLTADIDETSLNRVSFRKDGRTRRRLSILKTILNGIEGTPMPALAIAEQTEGGLDDDQVMALVLYVDRMMFSQDPAKESKP